MNAVMTPTTATAPPSIDQPARWDSGERRNHPRWTTSSYMSPRTRASVGAKWVRRSERLTGLPSEKMPLSSACS